MSRTPVILQHEAVECGAASLAMVLASHGRWVPLEELRQVCGVSRDGAKAANVLRAARLHGLRAKGFTKDTGALSQMHLPCVLFWNFNHFVVLTVMSAKFAVIHDPAVGRRKIAPQELDRSFTGVVLDFEPGPDFVTTARPAGAVDTLRTLASQTRAPTTYLLIAGLLAILPGYVLPTLSSIFVDRVLVRQQTGALQPLLIGIALTALFRLALGLLENSVLLQLQSRLSMASASRFFWHLLRLPLSYYTQRSPGEIGSRLPLTEAISAGLVNELVRGLLAMFTACFFAAMMFAYDATLAAIVLAAASCSCLLAVLTRRRVGDLSLKSAMEAGRVQAASMSGLSTMETLKTTGGERAFFARWAGYQARLMNCVLESQRLQLPLSLARGAITSVSQAAILGIGGLRVMQGALSVGELVAFQTLAASFLGPVSSAVELASALQQLKGNMSRVQDVLRHPARRMSDPSLAPAVHARRRLEGRLELRDVTFGYSRTEAPVVEALSFIAQPGERIALVGRSGCGKSTVAKLVMGLYEPWSGEILFDGKPRHAWSREQLAASLAAVEQEFVVFGESYRDNLSLWDATILEADLFRAARDACILEAILAQDGGLDARLDEGGRNLSGGMRQRLEIARSLADNPRILILDEATSALDAVTESAVIDNLRRRGLTTVAIAHRLSTIRNADQILVLDRGRVVEQGTHDDLVRLSHGHYAALIGAEAP